MKKVTLEIENSFERKTVALEAEASVGRTNAAQIVVADAGLSRVNTTFFRDGEDVLVADENSLNGTLLNGERITGRPKVLRHSDEIRIGSETLIRVVIEEDSSAETPKSGENFISNRGFAASGFGAENASFNKDATENLRNTFPPQSSQSAISNSQSNKPPFILIIGIASAFVIVFLGAAAYLVASYYENNQAANKGSKPVPTIMKSAVIPVRVVDAIGIEDPDDLDDLIASWEVEEEELKAEDIEVVRTEGIAGKVASDLKVSVEFWKTQREKALNHPGIQEPLQLQPELMGRGVPKQTAKLAEIISQGIYKQPLDFADLAELQLKGALVELPMATETYVLDVGGSAGEEEFTSFDWDENGNKKTEPITPDHAKYKFLKQLADNFNYNLNNPRDRKQIRIRLLRMYNPKSRKFLEEICAAYYQRFKIPLRITSLTRSMDYQIGLNKTNANSFRVTGKNSLPPHTSGCAFDMSRKNLSYGEQNFIMAKLAEMERAQKIDSLMEGSANACFHTFIFP